MTSRRGFTLVEALVSIFLLVMALLYIFNMLSLTRRGIRLSENHSNAAILGRSLLQETLQKGFDKMADSSGIYPLEGINNGQPSSQVMNYQVTITTVDADKKQLWATVTWQEKSGSKQVILETLCTKTQ